MKRAALLCAAFLAGCVGESSIDCGDNNVQIGDAHVVGCLCNCPDGLPGRVVDGGGDFCKTAGDGDTCCFWKTEQVLLVGSCAAQVCIVPIKGP